MIAVDVPWGCGAEGKGAEQSPRQTCKGRKREDPENEGSKSLTLIPQNSPTAICEQQQGRGGWGPKENLTYKETKKKRKKANLSNFPL